MAALLARREADGLSLRALSEESGIPFGTLSWWSWRLRQTDAPTPRRRRRRPTPFVELIAADPQRSGEIVVRLDNGVVLELHSRVDVAWLRELVGALRSC
jgi:hypothetical protein